MQANLWIHMFLNSGAKSQWGVYVCFDDTVLIQEAQVCFEVFWNKAAFPAHLVRLDVWNNHTMMRWDSSFPSGVQCLNVNDAFWLHRVSFCHKFTSLQTLSLWSATQSCSVNKKRPEQDRVVWEQTQRRKKPHINWTQPRTNGLFQIQNSDYCKVFIFRGLPATGSAVCPWTEHWIYYLL